MVLLEPMLRRATFLDEVVADLELPGVTVVRARAEDYRQARTRAMDVVVARAVAPLDAWSAGRCRCFAPAACCWPQGCDRGPRAGRGCAAS